MITDYIEIKLVIMLRSNIRVYHGYLYSLAELQNVPHPLILIPYFFPIIESPLWLPYVKLYIPGGKNGIDLSQLLSQGAEIVDIEEEEEDQDCRLDPIFSVDLKKYLFTFLRYTADDSFVVKVFCGCRSPLSS